MFTKKNTLFLILCPIFLSITLNGQEVTNDPLPPRALEKVRKADLNRDGLISLEEFSALPSIENAEFSDVSKVFQHLDKDGNGTLSKEEIKLPKAPKRDPWKRRLMKRFDTNFDGKISREEFHNGDRPKHVSLEKVERIFQKLDKNRDGYISRQDHKTRKGKHAYLKAKILSAFTQIDADSSDSISLQELEMGTFVEIKKPKVLSKVFHHLDLNSDQLITRPELKKRDQKKNSNQTPPE